MTHFEKALKHTLGIEGEFSDHQDDPGGATRYGITEAVARRHGYYGSMRELPISRAKNIYRLAYWDELNLDQVAAISESIALKMFDAGVNVGTQRVGEWLQRLLNVFNAKGTKYRDIDVDGIVGPISIRMLGKYVHWREEEGIEVILKALDALQGSYYITLAERNEQFESFIYGWLRTRIS